MASQEDAMMKISHGTEAQKENSKTQNMGTSFIEKQMPSWIVAPMILQMQVFIVPSLHAMSAQSLSYRQA